MTRSPLPFAADVERAINQHGDDLAGRLRVIADQIGVIAKEMEPVAVGGDLDYQPNADEVRDWKDRLQYLCGHLHGTAIRLARKDRL